MPYCIAAALMDGEFTPRQLWKTRLVDPTVHALAARIKVSEDPEMTKALPKEWPVKMVFRMKDGTSFDRRLDRVKWSPYRTPTLTEMLDKFSLLAEPVIGASRAAQVAKAVEVLNPGSDLRPIFSALCPP